MPVMLSDHPFDALCLAASLDYQVFQHLTNWIYSGLKTAWSKPPWPANFGLWLLLEPWACRFLFWIKKIKPCIWVLISFMTGCPSWHNPLYFSKLRTGTIKLACFILARIIVLASTFFSLSHFAPAKSSLPLFFAHSLSCHCFVLWWCYSFPHDLPEKMFGSLCDVLNEIFRPQGFDTDIVCFHNLEESKVTQNNKSRIVVLHGPLDNNRKSLGKNNRKRKVVKTKNHNETNYKPLTIYFPHTFSWRESMRNRGFWAPTINY